MANISKKNQEQISQIVTHFINKTKDTYKEPSLFTQMVITVKAESQPSFTVSANDIVRLAEQLTLEVINENGDFLTGDGSRESPYILNHPKDWIRAALKLPNHPSSEKYIYFKSGDQIIHVEHVNKNVYASSPDLPKESFENNVISSSQQILQNLFSPENAYKITAISKATIDDEKENSDVTLMPFVLHLVQNLMAKSPSLTELSTAQKDLIRPPYDRVLSTYEQKSHNILNEILEKKPIDSSTIDTALSCLEESDEVINVSKLKNFLDGIIPEIVNTAAKFVPISDQALEPIKSILGKITEDIEEKDYSVAELDSLLSQFIQKINNVKSTTPDPGPLTIAGEPITSSDSLLSLVKKLFSNRVSFFTDPFETTSITEVRDLLRGDAYHTNTHLPVTTVALFLSETSRYRACFLASLVLLDLAETRSDCSDIDEKYTLQNMLSSPSSRTHFVDAYGKLFLPADELKEKTDLKKESKDLFPSIKSSLEQDLEKEINTQVNTAISEKLSVFVGGYQPMVQADATKNIDNTQLTKLLLPQQKMASLLFEWLFLYIPCDQYDVSLKKCFLEEKEQDENKNEDQKNEFLKKIIIPLLQERMTNFNMMNNAANALYDFTGLSLSPTSNKDKDFSLYEAVCFYTQGDANELRSSVISAVDCYPNKEDLFKRIGFGIFILELMNITKQPIICVFLNHNVIFYNSGMSGLNLADPIFIYYDGNYFHGLLNKEERYTNQKVYQKLRSLSPHSFSAFLPRKNRSNSRLLSNNDIDENKVEDLPILSDSIKVSNSVSLNPGETRPKTPTSPVSAVRTLGIFGQDNNQQNTNIDMANGQQLGL